MNFKELQNEEIAINFLSDHLIDGTLVLFLGAGVSQGFGLPGWVNLVNSFRNKVGLLNLNDTSSAEKIQNGMEEALDEIKNDEQRKVEIIKGILYPDRIKLNVKAAFSNHLLIALSSLLIGRKRGHVKRVVTFNYDSMLEWFLSLFGFEVNSVIELPALEGSEDVRIYHPHGFVPHPSLNLGESSFLILGMKDANNRLGKRGDLWFEKLRQIIETGICLFVGLSGSSLSDRAIAPLLSSVGDDVQKERPLGVWIYFDTKVPLDSDKRREFLRNNIAPIEIDDVEKVAEFVLKISQKALEKQKNL